MDNFDLYGLEIDLEEAQEDADLVDLIGDPDEEPGDPWLLDPGFDDLY